MPPVLEDHGEGSSSNEEIGVTLDPAFLRAHSLAPSNLVDHFEEVGEAPLALGDGTVQENPPPHLLLPVPLLLPRF